MTNQRAITLLLIEESKRENEIFLSTVFFLGLFNQEKGDGAPIGHKSN